MRGSVRAMALTGGVLSAQCQAGIRGAPSEPVRAIDGPPTTTPSSRRPFDRQRFVRRVVVAGSLAVVGIQVVLYVVGWLANHVAIPLGLDWLGYRAGFDRLLATGTPYAPFELAGAFTPEHLDFIHPPNALVLFAPFAILPQPLDYILWIAIPIAIFCYLLRGLPWWAWPAVALLSTTNSLQYPILNGNSSLFMTAIFGLGFRYGWVVGLLAMKPTLAPLAIAGSAGSGARHGRILVAAGLAVIPILVTLPWLADYITVARNMQGIPLTYSVSNYSLIALAALPWVADKLPGWIARARRRARLGRPTQLPSANPPDRSLDGRAGVTDASAEARRTATRTRATATHTRTGAAMAAAARTIAPASRAATVTCPFPWRTTTHAQAANGSSATG